jgi:uncharacterized membrane protein YjdF
MSDVARVLVDCFSVYLCFLCISENRRGVAESTRVIYVQPTGEVATAEALAVLGSNGMAWDPRGDTACRPLVACSTMAREN